MILIQATIKYKGYNPEDLKPKSHSRICVSCDSCGRVRWINNSQYKPLCIKCCQMGERNGFYGKHHSDKSKKLQSDVKIGKYTKENHPSWKGGLPLRTHVLLENECRKMNKRFNDSEFHHLSKSIGIYIPKILHRHLYHNLKSGKGMDEMSILAFQFIKGEL